MSWLLDMRPRGAGGGGGAPLDATFITQTPSGTLTNEQALSLLATGLLKGTTGTGVVSIAVPTVDYASALQGALADSAVQPGDLAMVAFSGDYGDLLNLPTLGTMAAFNDAPSDGNTYGRNNGAWAVVAAGVSPPFVDETAIVYRTGNVAITQTHDINAYTVARVVAWPDAAGTVALLEVAQTFTAAQTIQGATDTQQLIIRSSGNPQTANLMELRSTAATVYASFSPVGDLRLGAGSSTGAAAIGQNAPDSTRYGLRIDKLFATAGTSAAVQGEWGSTNSNDTYGLDYIARAHHTSGVMSNLVGLRTGIRKSNTANVTLAAALIARAPVLASTGVIATNYGLKVEDQTGANITTAYAIFTGAGLVRFGDSAEILQTSPTGLKPTLRLQQLDLSEEFIRFDSTVGAGNPIDTAALGAYYGKVRVYVQGVGFKSMALYD